MLRKKKPKYILALMLIGLLCLLSCTGVKCNRVCPTYPIAGSKVARELEQASGEEYPNTWEWLGRIDKLRQELELCR